MKSSILKLAVALLRCLYAPIKLSTIKNKITIISRQSNEPSRDIALLSDYIRENYPDIQCQVMTKKLEGANLLSYGFHMLSQMKAIATSKVVIIDGYCIAVSVLKHKRGTTIIQMWHALAAIKKFGYQTLDKAAGHSSSTAEALCMHKNYDYIIAPSMETGRLFCKGFGDREDKLVYMGLPRVDDILSIKTRPLRQEFNIGEDQEIILYAPTFRKGEDVPLSELIGAIKTLNKKAYDIYGGLHDRYVLVVKLHPLYADSFEEAEEKVCRVIIDNNYTTYDWLKVCDRIITDYSALGVEASLTAKPLYFYLYDLEEYEESVGLNVNPALEVPQAVAKSGPELAEIMDREYDYESLNKFRDKYISVETTGCTARLGEFVANMVINR